MNPALSIMGALAIALLCACGDNYHPGGGTLIVSPQIDLQTTENGGTSTVMVALSNPPAGELTVELISMDVTEGTVSPATITFDRHDYADPHTVTIHGVDDDRADGNQSYTVRLSAPFVGAVDLDVTNRDDDMVGVDVSPLLGLMTSETGTTATFQVSLTSQPAADVIMPIATTDDTEGVADKGTLVFNENNWFTPQIVTITGQQDALSDGTVSYTIVIGPAISADSAYHRFDPDDITLVNVDDDLKGITVTAPSSLMTTETGATATFSVVLQSQPSANVTIAVASSDTSEADVSTTPLVFTPASWNVAQTVTVMGVDDFIDDGDQPFTIMLGAATSTDTMYNGIDPNDPVGVNVDNDGVSISVQPTTPIAVSESGTSEVFNVVLGSQPSANVTIDVASSDTTEATVSTAQLVFTPANWNLAQTVTVTGVDDPVDDGDQPFSIVLGAAVSTDATYNGIDPTDLAGTNADNDTASILVQPTSGLVTSEVGGSDAFNVVLTSEPSGTVTIAVASSDASEGTTVQSSLTFTPANWNQAQTVNVIGVDDVLADSLQTYTIILSPAVSSDSLYAGMDPADVSVTNLDNDVSGVTVDPTSGLVVSEFGDTDTFTIVLDTAPTANVTISLTSSRPLEGTVLPTSVTFTPSNWNVPQTVTVTGVNDALADGNQIFTIVTGNAQSTDPTYSNLAVADVEVTNIDNDTAQVYVKARRRLLVSENGQSSTFRVRLTVQPTATVTCTLTSTDTSEGLVSPPTLVFQPNNFGFVTVTVSGVDDQIVDGDVLFTILLDACTSTDPQYSGSDPRDVTVINRDND
jgi:large repetitive protein